MKLLRNQTRRTLTCLLIGWGLATTGAADTNLPAWYLLEFADSRPPCMDKPAESRCIGTRPRTTLFEIRDGERIEMPVGTALPPVWVEFNRLWTYAPGTAIGPTMRSIQLDATPLGARLIILDQNRQYLQSVPVGSWAVLEHGNQSKLWVRVSISQP